MEQLKAHIAAEPGKPMQAWADQFGISRPHLHALADGSRQPSLEVAQRIQTATGGAVPLTSWPNIKAILDAARGAA